MRILVQRPLVFDYEQGEAVTVNSNLYRAMLNEFLSTKIEEGILATNTIDALTDSISEAIGEILHTAHNR